MVAVGGLDPRLWVIGGFCGRPVSDVGVLDHQRHVAGARGPHAAHAEGIFACGAVGEPDSELQIRLFGGELVAASANSEAGEYTDGRQPRPSSGRVEDECGRGGHGLRLDLWLCGGQQLCGVRWNCGVFRRRQRCRAH